MIMKTIKISSVFYITLMTFLSVTINSCDGSSSGEETPEKETVMRNVLPTESLLQYNGRNDMSTPQEPKLFWAGSGITFWFEGESLEVIMDDENGDNYYNIIIDDNYQEKTVFKCSKGERTYTFNGEITTGIHKVQINRRTGPDTGQTIFKGLRVNESAKFHPNPNPSTLKIEFYGDSISVGHGVLDDSRNDNDNKATWDNYKAYSFRTAANLNADYRCIAMSGIGVMVSWFPLIMPDLYDRLDPSDENSTWDFNQWTPDIVVVNLFQNDAWLINNLNPVPTDEERIQAYIDFITTLRGKYANAHIICALGNMDASGSAWETYVLEAVDRMKATDSKVYSQIFPTKGTGGHPTVSEQKAMTDQLTSFINGTLL